MSRYEGADPAPSPAHHQLAKVVKVVSEPQLKVPQNKRVPFGWGAFAVLLAGEVQLHWPQRPLDGHARLRLTVALDDREEKLVDVFTLHSNQAVGRFDLRYAYALQPFEVVLEPPAARAATREGVGLRVSRGATPLWILDTPHAPALCPHLLFEAATDPLKEFYRRLLSLDSVQPLGWLEGCVLDGLFDLRQALGVGRIEAAILRHLNLFVTGAGELVYENPRGEPADGTIYGIEATLPFAVWAKLWPEHPALELVRKSWLTRRDAQGLVQDGATTSAEGSYTVAYPMAVLAKHCGFAELEQLAIDQLRFRKERLVAGGDIYLRAHGDGSHTFCNWARGVAWYLLGLVRSLIELKHRSDLDDLKEEARRAASWAMALQQPSGLWRCFLSEPETEVDTSGSAGIAAALALGAKHGLLPSSARQAAEQTLRALERYLSPDGFLMAVAQANRGGERLQRSSYRVISQMATGLMAQLIAALGEPETSPPS
ncbi:MAG: glycoside hydrolase family 88 protein [Deinococcota bacterium]|nr:glycoside hydrolase family 88 protein [Deinococcota bacterium]